MQDILSKLEASRKELLDLSLHNPLLNYRPLSSRGVQIKDEQAAEVYDKLVREARSLSFAPQMEGGGPPEAYLAEDKKTSESEGRYRETVLQTGETENALQTRLLNTYY